MAEILSYNPYRDMHNDVQFSAMFFGKNIQNIPIFNPTQTIEVKRLYYSFEHFTFTGKERDSETGFSYFGARYYDSDILTGWLSVDPMADKYPSLSPYNYCAWNPVKLVDPDGRDTINIKYNSSEGKWNFDKPIISKGNDVFNVTDVDGNITQTIFDEGNYSERMCVLNLEETGGVTLGVFHISGECADWATGYVATPAGMPSLKEGSGRRLPDGIYPLSPTVGVNFKWVQPIVYEGRAIKIHPTGNSTKAWSSVAQWTTGCYIIGTTYIINKNNLQFNPTDSRVTSLSLNTFLGATKNYSNIGTHKYPGSVFDNGMKKMTLIQKGGIF